MFKSIRARLVMAFTTLLFACTPAAYANWSDEHKAYACHQTIPEAMELLVMHSNNVPKEVFKATVLVDRDLTVYQRYVLYRAAQFLYTQEITVSEAVTWLAVYLETCVRMIGSGELHLKPNTPKSKSS